MNSGSEHPRSDAALTPEERALAERIARTAPSPDPSPALDARILDAARAAVAQPSQQAYAPPSRRAPARRRRRWPVSFGIAATLLIAFGVAWQLRPVDDAVTVYSEAPRVAASPRTSGPQAADDLQQGNAPVDTDAGAARAREAEADDPALAAAAHVDEKAEMAAAPPASSPAKATQDRGDEPAQPVTAPREPPMAAPGAARMQPPASPASPAPPPTPPPPSAVQSVTSVPAPAPTPESNGSASAAMAVPQDRVLDQSVEKRTKSRAAQADEAAPQAATRTQSGESYRQLQRPDAVPDVASFGDQPVDDQPPASADSPEVREAWLKRIHLLLGNGEREAARASLLEYRRRYPDVAIPDDLRPLLVE